MFIAIYDACVLYPAPLRDLLMHLSLTGLFSAKWTERIHEEWIGNLLAARPDLNRRQLERTRELMNAHVEECLITDYEYLIPSLNLPDPNDRHVLAAAVTCHADVIVTFDLRDFPAEILDTFQLKAEHPDEFIAKLLQAAPDLVCTAARRQRANLKKPRKPVDEFLDSLERQGLVKTVTRLRGMTDEL